MFFVYAIFSQIRNYIYVGISNDIVRRLNEHKLGYNKTTKPYRPFLLIHQEQFPSRAEARKREIELKSTAGKRFLRSLIQEEE